MENLIPRSNPPQPKSLNIDPPLYSVPDVTLMFDSDDSLIWKPGENPKIINSKPNRNQKNISNNEASTQGRVERERFSGESNTENFQVDINKYNNGSEMFAASKFPGTNLQGKFVEKLQISNINSPPAYTNESPLSSSQDASSCNRNYNPELYCSPKQNIVLQTRLLPTLLKANHEAGIYNKINSQNQNYLNENHIPCETNHTEYVHKSESYLKNKRIYNCDCCQNIESLSSKFKPLSIKQPAIALQPQDENPCQNQNHYILKVVEEQNQHILYLQTILEKLLNAQNINDKKKQYTCENSKNKTIMKEAGTQTSFHNEVPIKRTVATNTNISWTELLSSAKQLNNQKQTCHPKKHSVQKFNSSGQDPNDYRNKSPEHEIASHSALQRNNSFTLGNVQMDTVYDSPSPEPSLHINISEFRDDDQWSDHVLQNEDDRALEENVIEEANCNDSPLVGESAMLYNERLRQNDALMRCQGEETSQEEKNGVTFYNKVMINVQHILHRSGGVDHNEKYDNDSMLHNTNNYNKKATVTRRRTEETIYQHEAGLTKQQLQQFGISFLDPVTLQDKRRVLPMADGFYSSDKPINMGNIHDLEILTDRRHNGRRNAIPHRFADSHLALIAQNSPGVFDIRREKIFTPPQDHKLPPKQKTEFSFATKHFLGKYDLEND